MLTDNRMTYRTKGLELKNGDSNLEYLNMKYVEKIRGGLHLE